MARFGVTIRPDIHARFLGIVVQADAKLKGEQKDVARKLATALAREKDESRLRHGREP